MTEQTMTIAIILIPAVMIALIGLRGMRDGAKAEAYRAEVDRAVADGTWKAAAKVATPAPPPEYGRSRLESIKAAQWRDLRRIDGIPKPGEKHPNVNAYVKNVAVEHSSLRNHATLKIEYECVPPVTEAWDWGTALPDRTFTRTYKVSGLGRECDHAGNPAHAVYCGKCGRMMDNKGLMSPKLTNSSGVR